VIKKENATPKGIPALIKLIKSGIEEQEQNGVAAPNKEANKFANAFLPANQLLTFPTGKNDLKNPITVIRTNKRRIILIES